MDNGETMSDKIFATICYGRGLPTSNTYNPKFKGGTLKIPVYKKRNYYVAYENEFKCYTSPCEGLLDMHRIESSDKIPLIIKKSKDSNGKKSSCDEFRLVDIPYHLWNPNKIFMG
jgi:hypothetical protein